MRSEARLHISVCAAVSAALVLAACTTSERGDTTDRAKTPGTSVQSRGHEAATPSGAARPTGRFTVAFAGDVHFSGRVASRLARNVRTVFGAAAPGLRSADLTMVNLETAITTGGDQQNKLFTFRAPPRALTALRDAGIDVATMANNHGADYGRSGLRDTFRAIKDTHFPVIGVGRNVRAAFEPYRTTLNGAKVAIFAADQVRDETTLPYFSAGPHSSGVANAYYRRLLTLVRRAHEAGDVVVVYLHWGIELQTCPSTDQSTLARQLAGAGAAAVIGTHAHVLQGAGWLADGTYVAYGLGNYLWWLSFGNDQDDNGVLTLSFDHDKVVKARFAPSHLDQRGVPMPATGAQKRRITAEWNGLRRCTTLSARPPG